MDDRRLTSMSSDTGVLSTSPVNSNLVLRPSTPDVPSNTCTTALSPSTSSTCPRRVDPSPSLMLTISAYWADCFLQGEVFFFFFF